MMATLLLSQGTPMILAGDELGHSQGGNNNADAQHTCITATSLHTGGVQVLMVDGAVRFVSENIDTGDLTATTPNRNNPNTRGRSPYGVWGALGTKRGGETIGEF